MAKFKMYGRDAFANFFNAKVMQTENGASKPTFGCSILIPKDDPQIAALNKVIEEVANAKWGAKAGAVLKSLRTGDKVCLHNGDAKAEYEGFEGMMYVSASNPVRPTVVDVDKTPLVEADGKPYSGCYSWHILDIWAQDNSFGKRINATLMGVQFAKHGESFSGGGVADIDDFDDIADAAEDDIPL